MSGQPLPPFLSHFAPLADPRQAAKVLYPLPEVLLLRLCATIAGADDFDVIALWGAEHLPFLRRFQPYPRGIRRELYCLWRAADPDRAVVDILGQSRRDAGAAKRFFRRTIARWRRP